MDGEENTKSIISMRKIAANRRNALRSTGPRTPQGKSAVRWNALQHGLLAKEIVIPAGVGRENVGESYNLLAQLREHLEPAGVLEELLVEKIAVCYWRLRRVLRSEVGEIQQGLDNIRAARESHWNLLKVLGQPRNTTEQEENRWMESEQACRNLPGSQIVDKILRYETAIERQLYRALHQLERIQRHRKGEAVPPPVSVEFSGER